MENPNPEIIKKEIKTASKLNKRKAAILFLIRANLDFLISLDAKTRKRTLKEWGIKGSYISSVNDEISVKHYETHYRK